MCQEIWGDELNNLEMSCCSTKNNLPRPEDFDSTRVKQTTAHVIIFHLVISARKSDIFSIFTLLSVLKYICFFRFLVSNESEGCSNFCSMFDEEEDIFL